MFKKPLFWIIFILLAVAGVFFLINYFPQVMSFVNVDITMSRKEAVTEAIRLSEELQLGPDQFETVAIFNTDYYTQIYVELEGGGKSRFNQMLVEDLYEPYKWEVRLFKENETREAKISFTPSGERYGFREKLPESMPGNNLSPEQALFLAEDFLRNNWQIDLNQFELIEEKSNQVISGRLDQAFVYERIGVSIEEAKYRLRVTVSGDRVTEVTNYMKIPEAFGRRYSEMRSANNTIATGGQIAMAVFYGFGGILLGIFLLLRKRWILWKTAVLWAFIVSFLGFISSFNYLPLSWFWYDTAISKSAFIFQNFIQYFTAFLSDFILLALSFIAAESLSRKAFPQHVQFWKVWKKGAAGSNRVLGNTLAGYIITVFSLTYITVFYFITTRYFNWWNPSSMLINPNVLATPFPWFSALATALHAGFWEEALFRAVPLAGMLLIGKRLHKEKLFLILGLILQLLIFGAGHANYAAQPSYARVVELIIPSLLFAYLFLRFGLLTAIILHFVFDAVLMSMPIWVSNDSSLLFSKILLVIFFFIPVWIVLYDRIKNKTSGDLKDRFLNKSWQPSPAEQKVTTAITPEEATARFKFSRILVILGILGFVIWAVFTEFQDNTISLEFGKKAAIRAAETELTKQGVELGPEWQVYAEVLNQPTEVDRYVWQEAGEELYKKWLGKLIPSARWRVRFVKFTGDVAARAEEYNLYVKDKAEVYSFSHSLPEDREGAVLEEETARMIALTALQQQFKVSSTGWKEISALPEKLPARRDWKFVFIDTLNYQLNESELRYTAVISGDRVTSLMRYIYVPEDWMREQKNLSRTADSLQNFTGIFQFLLFFLSFVLAIISWTKKKFDLRFFLQLLVFLIIVQLIILINRWPLFLLGFSSSEPFNNQVLGIILRRSLGLIVTSFSLAVIGGWLKFQFGQNVNTGKSLLPALLWSGITVAVITLLQLLLPVLEPFRDSFENLAYYSPFLGELFNNIPPYINLTILVFIIYWIVDTLSRKWTGKKGLTYVLLVILFWILLISRFLERLQVNYLIFIIISGIFAALLFILAYKNLLRFYPAAIFLITGMITCLRILRSAFFQNYPADWLYKFISLVFIAIISFLFWKRFRKVT